MRGVLGQQDRQRRQSPAVLVAEGHHDAAGAAQGRDCLLGFRAVRPRIVSDQDQPTPRHVYPQASRRHCPFHSGQRGAGITGRDRAEAPVLFVVGIGVDGVAQASVQRRLAARRRILGQAVVGRLMLVNPRGQARGQQCGNDRVLAVGSERNRDVDLLAKLLVAIVERVEFVDPRSG